MASSQIDSAVFQRTRETLGKIIKKPPLTDKLLGRPPFRYLHDIISQLSKQTRFFNGLYTAKEMDAKAIQERDDKVAFLQKAIDTLSFTTGEVVKVRPSKVVAGHEADKTNEFLQILGISILKELDSTEAVKRVLNGEKPTDTLTKERKKRSDKEKSSSKETRPDGKKGSRSRSKDRPGEERQPSSERGQAARGRHKEAEGNGSSLKSKSQRSLKENRVDEQPPSARPTHRPSRTRPPPESEPEANEQGDPHSPALSAEDEGPGSEQKLDRPPSAKGARRKTSLDSDPESAPPPEMTSSHENHVTTEAPPSPPGNASHSLLAPPLKRPGSARPAPPKIVQSNVEDTIARIPSGGPAGLEGPPVILDTPASDGEQSEGEDDEQFVVQDSTPLELPDTEAFHLKVSTTEDKPEGALTKNIVAMKERLEGDLPKSDQTTRINHPTLTEAQRQKEREIVTKEIEKLQASIQTLCKSANPLGKIMDYVQEDMDSMQKELEMWRTENDKHAESLRKEESITEQELSPLRALLEDLDSKVKEQIDLISATKANLVRNDEKMQQMLNSVTFVS